MLMYAYESGVSPEESFETMADIGDNELFRVVSDYAIIFKEENKSAIEEKYGVIIDGDPFSEFICGWDGGEWVEIYFLNRANYVQLGRGDVAAWLEAQSPEFQKEIHLRIYEADDIFEELNKVSYEAMLSILEEGVREFKRKWENNTIASWQ